MIFKSLSVSAWGAQLVTRLSRIRKRALVISWRVSSWVNSVL